jgi:prepilin-type N-terminal cleavage/methylation domain-containing protein
MKFNLLPSKPRAGKRARAAFTLAEVLIALVMMAILIPVAVDGVRLASLAGEVGERKATAARIAERVLNELVVTHQWQQTSQSDIVQEGVRDYRWSLRVEPWTEGNLSLMTVQVAYSAQGKEYEVHLSTLVDTMAQ